LLLDLRLLNRIKGLHYIGKQTQGGSSRKTAGSCAAFNRNDICISCAELFIETRNACARKEPQGPPVENIQAA